MSQPELFRVRSVVNHAFDHSSIDLCFEPLLCQIQKVSAYLCYFTHHCFEYHVCIYILEGRLFASRYLCSSLKFAHLQ